jgi:ubiquinone biosynthesis UbiH/UbiF/VisC/COQ6 family hydroxylase
MTDICIHGAGFVGQTLALHLAKNGFRVAIVADHATSADPAPLDIRAFALNPSSKALLEAVGAWPSGSATTPVRAMVVHGDSRGRLQFECAAAHNKNENKNDGALNWIVDVPALAHRLGEQVAAEPRITCLASKDAPEAALHVICEGKHSQLRAQLGIETETIVYPQHAIAARLVCEQPHGHTARQWFNERGEVLALLPLGGSDDSVALHEVALVWSLDSARAKKVMTLSPADFCAALQAACGQALGAMSLSSPLARWPLQLTRIQQWVGEAKQPQHDVQHGISHQANTRLWVLAGDAAHAVHPLAGQGLNLGLGDVQSLVTALGSLLGASPTFHPAPSLLMKTLRRYARERQAAASAVAATTDGLQVLFANGHPATAQLRNWGMSVLNRLAPLKNLLIRKAQ